MKKIITAFLFLTAIAGFMGCKKDGNYPGGQVSPYVSIFDVRDLYKGTDVTLSTDNLFGSAKITGVVISDHSEGNMPAGLLVLQDKRRLSRLSGIAIPIGADAASYVPGDSLIIDVVGSTLKNENGMLQLMGISNSKITKVMSGAIIDTTPVRANALLANRKIYESTLVSLTRVGFDASYPAGTTYAGNRIISDGFGNITLHTEATASFANDPIPFTANFTGIIFNPTSDTIPQLWARKRSDIKVTASEAPKIAPVVITGYLVDPSGTDANYEYIQLMATKTINFATTNYSLVTTNNAGANIPTGFPTNGWATGGMRTYKINITSGTVTRGQYFYVGANKNIAGSGSTDISSAFWVSKMYSTVAGDGFGTATTNLLANSGNAAGVSVFDLTNVTKDTMPVDVIFFGGAGSIYTAGPPEAGYKITNTDYYDVKNPSNQTPQPYFNQGTNTNKLAFPPATNFTRLGGRYNTTTGRWTTARTLNAVVLTPSSTRTEIEGATILEQ